MSNPDLQNYGWTAVPRNRSNLPQEHDAHASNIPIDFDKIWPSTTAVQRAQQYAKEHLDVKTYHHSLRVYCFGHTMVRQHFPTWVSSSTAPTFFETWALTVLFHDIGTTTGNRESTNLSFEFQGGFIALEQLVSFGVPRAQAESVCEAIIRHQDPGETGTISRMGQLVQLATELDNMGWQSYLVDKGVIEQVVQSFPRDKWSSCFANTIDAEIKAKPWCHTTAIPGFKEAVQGNQLMEPYD